MNSVEVLASMPLVTWKWHNGNIYISNGWWTNTKVTGTRLVSRKLKLWHFQVAMSTWKTELGSCGSMVFVDRLDSPLLHRLTLYGMFYQIDWIVQDLNLFFTNVCKTAQLCHHGTHAIYGSRRVFLSEAFRDYISTTSYNGLDTNLQTYVGMMHVWCPGIASTWL